MNLASLASSASRMGASGEPRPSEPVVPGAQSGKDYKHSIGSLETWEPPDKSFIKHRVRDGTGEKCPNYGSICSVMLTLIGNNECEESDLGGYKFNEAVEVTIGDGDTKLAHMLDAILMTMKENEHSYIKAKLDKKGNRVSDVAAATNPGLKFNVILKNFSRSCDLEELEQDEKLERAQEHKDKGTELFKKSNLEFAVKRYENALQYLIAMEPADNLSASQLSQYKTLKAQCYVNLAACSMKNEEYKDVISYCDKALGVQPDNIKGLFRRGQANKKLQEYTMARADFKRATEVEPDNKTVVNELNSVNALIRKEKEMYKKMLS